MNKSPLPENKIAKEIESVTAKYEVRLLKQKREADKDRIRWYLLGWISALIFLICLWALI